MGSWVSFFCEHTGNKAHRMGDWKIIAEYEKPWELYDVQRDRGETMDLASQRPEQLASMMSKWTQKAEEMGVVEWGSLPQSKSSPGPDYRKK